MYPSRQASQDSDSGPPNQCRAIQTGNSLLRMYLKKADKGQQVCDRPQAFFLPLDQKSPDDHDFIDLETSTETDVTDLQEALRKHRPDYIAAAEERAGRVSRNNEDKKNNDEKKFKDSPMTRSTEMKVKKQPTVNQMKRSQSTPRVNSILKMNNSITNSNGMGAHKNGISNKLEKKSEKKTVTIVQNGDQKKSRANVAVLKSRTSNVTQQHYNIKNIYAPDPVKGLKNKVY